LNLTQALVLLLSLSAMLAAIARKIRMDAAAISILVGIALMQYAGLGVLGPPDTPSAALRALSGFGQPPMVVLASLFIITSVLKKSGFTNHITRFILKWGQNSSRRLLLLFTLSAALLSQIINNVAAGALLIPTALEVARCTGIKPSKLLIPLSFGSLLGGMATYFTTANFMVDNLLQNASPPQAGLGILSFIPTGGLVLLAGLVFMALSGDRLLADHETAARGHKPTASELEELYRLGERTWQAKVFPGSPLAGKTLRELGLGGFYGLNLVAIQRGGDKLLFPNTNLALHPNDRLVIIGREERVQKLADSGLGIQAEHGHNPLSQLGISVFELLMTPHSAMIGKTLKELDFRNQYGWSVLALQRGSHSYRTDLGDMRIAAGDSLLVAGESVRRGALVSGGDFLLLEPDPADQPTRLRETAISLGLLLAAVAAALCGVPIYLALLSAAVLTILSGVVSMQEAYQAIEWQVIFVMGGTYSLNLALAQTGLSEAARLGMMEIAGVFGPLGLAGSAFLASALLCQLVGGQVVILITGPIAIGAAIGLGIDPRAIAVAAAIGSSASFLSPLAHPVNLMVVVPGGYTTRDFFRVGWRLFLISFVTLLAGMRLFWGL